MRLPASRIAGIAAMRYSRFLPMIWVPTAAPLNEPGLKRKRNNLMLIRNARPALLIAAAVTLVALVGGPARGTSAPARTTGKVSKNKQIQRRMITAEEVERIREVRAALK